MCRQPVEAKQMIDIIVELSPPPPEPSPIDTANKLYDKLRSGRSSKLTVCYKKDKRGGERGEVKELLMYTHPSACYVR